MLSTTELVSSNLVKILLRKKLTEIRSRKLTRDTEQKISLTVTFSSVSPVDSEPYTYNNVALSGPYDVLLIGAHDHKKTYYGP